MRADRGRWSATVLEFRRAISANTYLYERRIYGLDSVSVYIENNTKLPTDILTVPFKRKSCKEQS